MIEEKNKIRVLAESGFYCPGIVVRIIRRDLEGKRLAIPRSDKQIIWDNILPNFILKDRKVFFSPQAFYSVIKRSGDRHFLFKDKPIKIARGENFHITISWKKINLIPSVPFSLEYGILLKEGGTEKH